MTEKIHLQLREFGAFLSTRRERILAAWHSSADADPEQTTSILLNRSQFLDHIPQVLDALEAKLRTRPDSRGAMAADEAKKQEEVQHGRHRWHQGYRLRELMREWGHLHLCLFDQLNAYASAHPDFERESWVAANRELISFFSEAVGESTAQYIRLQQNEAAGRVAELQRMLSDFNELERQRASLLRQAVHDLRGNVQSVSHAAEALRAIEVEESERLEYAELLQKGTRAVGSMLGDLMDLARLEGGQERREISRFDAAQVLNELCSLTQPFAAERGLFLRGEGPASLVVEGDEGKVRRIAQNLVLNGLKYSESGGVTVNWLEGGTDSWAFVVKDTGPGLPLGPGTPAPMQPGDSAASRGRAGQSESGPGDRSPAASPLPSPASRPGEGIGLSIVRRLCELLGARLELVASTPSGTTFRVVLPRRYLAAVVN